MLIDVVYHAWKLCLRLRGKKSSGLHVVVHEPGFSFLVVCFAVKFNLVGSPDANSFRTINSKIQETTSDVWTTQVTKM